MLPALAPVAVALAGATTWGVDVVAVPPDTRCPSREDLAAAVAARVPDDVAGWVAWYRVDAWYEPPAENRLRFELRDQGGRLRLRRELAVGDEGCAAVAEGLALIVERFFDEVAWTASVPLPELERAPDPPPRRRWEVQVGAAARREIAFAPGLALDVRAGLAGTWVGVAGLILQPAAVTDPDLPRMELLSLPLRSSARRIVTAGGMVFELGPSVSVAVERGRSTGDAAGPPRYRLVGAVGLAGAARRWLTPKWAVAIEAGADVTLPGASAFVVDGSGEVLRPAPIQVIGMLGISRVLGE